MKEIRLAIKIVKTLTKDRMLYSGRLLLDLITLVARCGVLLVLYYYVYQLRGGSINGTTYIYVAWSMFFYFAFLSLRLGDIGKTIMKDVQSGYVEVLFNKPISYLLYRIWWQIGSVVYSFMFISIIGSIFLFLIIGIPTTMTLSIFLPTLFLVFILSAILSLILYIIVGLLAFWIEDVNPIGWIVQKATMILGGSYLPIALFPVFMYKIAIWSPFGASLFITHTVYTSWQSEWYFLVSIQCLWIIILGSIMLLMFNNARKKLSVNGG